ncbi:hypothetical protein KFE25_014399 [Diacronema lutheri]|uniref:Na+/H+ antiporter NhaA n=3 Tax=Diacronema lutheri TaxID=2081491 RepID=A0A8J5X3B2_DIALT|nr:hypothetical protein KFE25_014399 [Diacronema lutheri]
MRCANVLCALATLAAPCAGYARASAGGARVPALGGARIVVRAPARLAIVARGSGGARWRRPLVAHAASDAAHDSASKPECGLANPTLCGPSTSSSFLQRLLAWQEVGGGGAVLLCATALSLALANYGPTSAAWLRLWSAPRGLTVAGHALSLRGWCNEGLMAVFFFVVGLEIKQELRTGSLRTAKTAILPCIGALGGMLTPMAVYAAVNLSGRFAGGSLAALAVPMATDIAFAMAIFSLFKSRMPSSASAFLLTLATVDDLGAIIVLATCYATGVSAPFLGIAALTTLALALAGRRQARTGADVRVFAAGGAALWWCLLRAGVSADIAGVVAALCVSTRATVDSEPVTERLIHRLSPLTTFFIMPIFALANTAVPLAQALGGKAGAAVAPAIGVALGLLVGKPLGIFGFTWLAHKLGVARMSTDMSNAHLAVVSTLGAIGFTMCLLLTEVALPPAATPLPKLAVLVASAVASVVAAAMMRFGLAVRDPAPAPAA